MSARELTGTLPGAAGRDGHALNISASGLVLAGLFAFGLFLRLAELDRILPDEHEARQALAAWRVLNPQLPGAQQVPESPLLFALQTLLFSVFGASEVTLRLPVALAGAVLPFMPLLFRDALGRSRSIAFCVLLAASPVLLLASRQSAAVVISLLLTALILWSILRHAQTRQSSHAVLATVLSGLLLLLSEPAGIVLALLAGTSLCLAMRWDRRVNTQRDPWQAARDLMHNWPVGTALPLALLTAFLVATLFMLHPGGLAAVGELLTEFVTGFVTPRSGAPPLHALQVAMFFEPVLLLLALLRLLQLRKCEPDFADRILIIWTLLAVVATLLWRSAGPEHALWLTVPLAGLASGLVKEPRAANETQRSVPLRVTLLALLASFALLSLFSLHLQAFVRSSGQPVFPLIHLVWMVLALLMLGLGCARLALDLGWPAALRLSGGGLLLLALAASPGSGWTTAVTRADDPAGLWQVRPMAREAWLLRDTLQILAQRESGGFPRLEIYAQTGGQARTEWLLRDFTRVYFIERARDAQGKGVLLLPWSAEAQALGGDYVGQDFVISRSRYSNASGLLPDWLPGRADSVIQTEKLVLWLRRDIYDGASQNAMTGPARP